MNSLLVKISLYLLLAFVTIGGVLLIGARLNSVSEVEAEQISIDYIEAIIDGSIESNNSTVTNFSPTRYTLSTNADKVGVRATNSIQTEFLLYNDLISQPLVAVVSVGPNFPNTFSEWTASILRVESNIGGDFDLENTNCTAKKITDDLTQEQIDLIKTDYSVCLRLNAELE